MIRWGIIGCGKVCEVKSGPGFQGATDSTLVAVMRRDGAKAADFARRHQVERWYDDGHQLINDPGVDAVYIATPVDHHESWALAVAAAGKPCYVEKPMARSGAECQRMIAAFAAAQQPLFVAYYRRALPRFVHAKALLHSGAIGPITGVSYRLSTPRHRSLNGDHLEWRLQAAASGGGLVMDLGSHALDLIDFLLGDLQAIGGNAINCASPCAVEDRVAVTFWAGRTLGTASWNFAAGVNEDELIIDGTDGQLRCSVFGGDGLHLETARGSETIAIAHPLHIQQPLIQTMVDQLLGRGTCPSTGDSALRTNLVLDAALNDYYQGRDDAFWQRPQTWRKPHP